MRHPLFSPLLFFLLIAGISDSLKAQTSLEDLPPEQYFDFWIGEWNLMWADPDSTAGTGFNKIERILDGAVIKESFEGLTGASAGYLGRSYTVYKADTGEWKQTWVDNTGDYLEFTGEFEGNNRMFTRLGTDQDGNDILQRMIFYDIRQDSFTWDWESSSDNGATWDLNWRIRYRRAN